MVSRLLRRVHCFQRRADGAYAVAGTERCSRLSQGPLNPLCERVLAPEYAPRCPFRLLERRHGLVEISESGVVVTVERLRVIPLHPERNLMILPDNTSRHGHHFAQQRLGFFEAPESKKCRRVVVGSRKGSSIFLAKELQTSGVDVS